MRLLKSLIKYLVLFSTFYLLPYGYKHLVLYPYVNDNVVKLSHQFGTGTGFFYEYNNHQYIVTNFHICYKAKFLHFKYNDKDFFAAPFEGDEKNDLCLLDVSKNTLPLFSYLNTFINQEIFSIGFMYNTERMILEGVVSKEETALSNMFPIRSDKDVTECNKLYGSHLGYTLNGIYSCQIEDTFIMTTIMIGPGQSGSPVLNYLGSVVGIITNYDGRTRMCNYIPIERVNELIERIN